MTLIVFNFRVLEKFYVGELVDNELPIFPQQRYQQFHVCCNVCNSVCLTVSSNFYKVLKDRVSKYMKDNNIVSI